jgi:hypothetical protein
MQPGVDEYGGPSSELRQLCDRVTVELDNFRKVIEEVAGPGSVARPDRQADS